MTERQISGLDNIPAVGSPDELRDFLNGGALFDLASRLDMANKIYGGEKFTLREEEREFSAGWIYKNYKRLLVVQNSISRLPGMFLSLPVEPDEYTVGRGEISASFTLANQERRVPEAYSEGMVTVGSPNAVVKIVIVAGQELAAASGIVTPKDI